VVSGYVLGYGGFLLLGGRTADLAGRRRVFVAALAVFAVASLVGALVSDGPLMVLTRIVKGASAAFTAPAGLAIITTTFAEGPQRNRALSIYTTCAAAGFSLGLVLSGLLTELSWRWTFLLPAPVAVLALVGALALVDRDEPVRGAQRRFDLLGAVTVTAGLLLLVYTVSQAQDAGWASPRTVLGLIGAAVLLAGFLVVELRTPDPLLRLGLLRSRLVAGGNLAGFAFFGSYLGFSFIATLYLQSLLGWSALQTALGFLPAGVIVAASSARISALIGRFGTTRLMLVGFVLLVLSFANFLRIGEHSQYATTVLPSIVLLGWSFALTFPCINIQATNGVPGHEQGMAGGLVNASFQVGGAVVLAVVTAVVTAGTGHGTDAHAQLSGYRPGLAVAVGVALAGLVCAVLVAVLERRAAARGGTPSVSDQDAVGHRQAASTVSG
jgi:MFS family permease